MVNGALEFCGALMLVKNVLRLAKDKEVKGVTWWATAYFMGWGFWNLFYYPSLDQWYSFIGGCCIVTINVIWLAMMLYYRNKQKPV